MSRPGTGPVGLVVEGQSDYAAIPLLLKRLGIRCGAAIHGAGAWSELPVRDVVLQSIGPSVLPMLHRGFTRVIVVLDLESRACPVGYAREVKSELDTYVGALGPATHPPVRVVCAETKLENWLIADPDGVYSLAFVQKRIASQVRNTADGKDALAILKHALGTRRYQKTRHAPKLAAKVDCTSRNVLARSKSLAKLVREATV